MTDRRRHKISRPRENPLPLSNKEHGDDDAPSSFSRPNAGKVLSSTQFVDINSNLFRQRSKRPTGKERSRNLQIPNLKRSSPILNVHTTSPANQDEDCSTRSVGQPKNRNSQSRPTYHRKENNYESGNENSSMEEAPSTLPRDSSRICIVEEETGEVFFRKLSSRQNKDRLLAAAASHSSNPNHDEENKTEKVQMVTRQDVNSPKSVDIEEEDDDVGDKLVFSQQSSHNLIRNVVKPTTTTVSEDSDEDDDDDDDEDTLTSDNYSSESIAVEDSLVERKGILKKPTASDSSTDVNCNSKPSETSINLELQRSSSTTLAKVPQLSSKGKGESSFYNNTNTIVRRRPTNISHAPGMRVTRQGNLQRSFHHHWPRTRSRGLGGFPSTFLPRLFQYLPSEDIKTCRMVCKLWNQLITESDFWTERMVALITDYGGGFWSSRIDHVGPKCAAYLGSSKFRFKSWKYMRLRQLGSHNLDLLLTYHASTISRAVKHISCLELSHCKLIWSDVLELLYHFRALKTLKINHCVFGNQAYGCGNVLNGSAENPDYPDLLQDLQAKFPSEDYCYSSIRNIFFQETERQNSAMTCTLFTLLKDRTTEIEEVNLQLKPSMLVLQERESHKRLWEAVHSFLVDKNITKCTIQSDQPLTVAMVSRFFTAMKMWNTTDQPTDTLPRWKMKELDIQLHPIILCNEFVALFRRFPLLRRLSLQHVVLRDRKSVRLLEYLMGCCPRVCQVAVGVILDDDVSSECGYRKDKLASSELYRNSLVSIEVCIQSTTVADLRDLIPGKHGVYFASLRTLVVKINESYQRKFTHFNMNMVVVSFPNLKELIIIDGPPLKRNCLLPSCFGSDNLWRNMSGASIGDSDIQLILSCLTNLEKLEIRANMKYVTDHGFTGYSVAHCRKIRKTVQNSRARDKKQELRVGVSFANIPNLQHLSLEGLGPGVTDATAYLAFDEIQRMQHIFIDGAHHVRLKLLELNDQIPTDVSVIYRYLGLVSNIFVEPSQIVSLEYHNIQQNPCDRLAKVYK